MQYDLWGNLGEVYLSDLGNSDSSRSITKNTGTRRTAGLITLVMDLHKIFFGEPMSSRGYLYTLLL